MASSLVIAYILTIIHIITYHNYNCHELVDVTTRIGEVDIFGRPFLGNRFKITDEIENSRKMKIPRLGLRFTHLDNNIKSLYKLTKFALDYLDVRMIDLPYGKEETVLKAIRDSSLNREDVFLIHKQNYTMFGTDDTTKEIEDFFKRTGLKYIDLYLIHFMDTKGFYLQTWKTMIGYKHKGLIRSIGLANVNYAHVNYLYKQTGVYPTVVQLEVHPFFQQRKSVSHFIEKGIIVQAYATLANAEKLHNARLQTLSNQYQKTVPQIMVRWCLQQNYSCLIRSRRLNRIAENTDVFDFEIAPEDMQEISDLEEGYSTCFDPTDKEHLRSVDETIQHKLDQRGMPLEHQFSVYELPEVESQNKTYSTVDENAKLSNGIEQRKNEMVGEIKSKLNFKLSTERSKNEINKQRNPDILSDGLEEDHIISLNGETAGKDDIHREEQPEDIVIQKYYFSTDINLEPNVKLADSALEQDEDYKIDWMDSDKDVFHNNVVPTDNQEQHAYDKTKISDSNKVVNGVSDEFVNVASDGVSTVTTESQIFRVPLHGVNGACERLSKKMVEKSIKEI